ncbi:MAG: hypothetical protein H6598_04815 [Flavobacteriales bacterium]|nr:hypothetical protein [Flavobacteriales bacterium]
MKRILDYTTPNLIMIKRNLINLKDQGCPMEYEIRIDGLKVVGRTSDLAKFYLHQKSLTDDSHEVKFLLYKGKSRNYDQYLLTRRNSISPNSNMTTEEYIASEVERRMNLHRQQMELASLREKTKSQKKLIISLKEQLTNLQAKDKGDIKSLLELLKTQFVPQANSSSPNINGVPNEELASMISHYRNQFGDEIFGEALGIALQVAENAQIIPEVKEFINQKTQRHESSEK